MPAKPSSPAIPLPRAWPSRVKSAILHVISLAQFAIAYTRGWAADSINTRVRLKAERDRALHDNALLREEVRIKDVRMGRIPPHRRPLYPPTERMAILEVKAARGWSLEQTAKAFLVTAATIASWMGRVDEEGLDALVPLPVPVNKFPDFVRYLVQRLKTLCPMLGKVKIAQVLARAGLHLGQTTVGRILEEKPAPKPAATQPSQTKQRVVTSKYPNHLWMADLTTVSIGSGFWATWLPFSLPQRWPFCWWVGVVIDHYSRRIVGVTLFWQEPTSEAVRAFLGRVIHAAKAKPRHLVTDKGPQFWNKNFKAWCRCSEKRSGESCSNWPRGTIPNVRTWRWAARPRTRCTTHAFPPTASHASSRAPSGRVVRRVPGRGPWSKASRACGSNSMSSFRQAVGICPSCACGVAVQRCHAACTDDCGLRTQCASAFVNRGLLVRCQRSARASRHLR